MREKERLIRIIFRLLALIENKSNQSIISQIKGLLNEIRNID